MTEMTLTTQELERIEREVLQYPVWVQKHYYVMVANGQSPRFALMCACQQAPGTRYTDRTFNVERHQVMNEMKPKTREKYLQQARQAGISTQGKYYVGALGRPTDRRAWVSTVDDATAVCREKNLTAEGIVKHNGWQVPPKKKRMADDLRDAYVRERLSHDAPLAAKCAGDPRELRRVQDEVVDRHAPSRTSIEP